MNNLWETWSALKACNFIRKGLQHFFFLWILQNFQEHLFWRTSTASACRQNCKYSVCMLNIVRRIASTVIELFYFTPLSDNPTEWSHWNGTLKQFVGSLPTNFLSVFDHFMGLALKGLKNIQSEVLTFRLSDIFRETWLLCHFFINRWI